ncbi:hypothetical protein [Streptomyces flaveolus]|uniref:hypothetical protein n=1 Tax=Streptomyces flaveolus TaxID=67297 RepID=UPI00367C3DE3
MSPKILAASGTVVVLALIASLFYALNLPPFQEKAVIHAGAVCSSLGNKNAAASALRDILPEAPSYSFDGETTDPRTDKRDDSYENWCFIDGDGKQLLSARTEMLEYEQADDWVKEAVAQGDSTVGLERFAAGDEAVASSRIAAIYVPCAAEGASRHLSVVVRLKRQGDVETSVLRQGLMTLAKGAASYAHEAAHCELVSKVPG